MDTSKDILLYNMVVRLATLAQDVESGKATPNDTAQDIRKEMGLILPDIALPVEQRKYAHELLRGVSDND